MFENKEQTRKDKAKAMVVVAAAGAKKENRKELNNFVEFVYFLIPISFMEALCKEQIETKSRAKKIII